MANFFFDGSKLFHHLDRVNDWMKGEEIAPVHVEISPTSACNHRCVFCYADHNQHKMGTLKRDLYLDLMRDLGHTGVRSCLLAGDGEPLVNKHTKDAIKVGKEAGVDMALNSNAILMTEDTAREVLPYLTWARFSVMGHDPETYAKLHVTKETDFELALANITKAAEIKKELGLDVTLGIQQVLLPENGHGIDELARRAKLTGADYFVVKPFSVDNKNDYKGETALDLMERHRDVLERAEAYADDDFAVIIRWNTFSDDGSRDYQRCLGLPFISQIGADGKVYTCCPFFGDENYVLGDLHEMGFKELWFSDKAKEVRDHVRDNQNVHECMTFCRHHQINKSLWGLKNPPDHVNFI